MLNFRAQLHSEIPVSTQLLNQLSFVIACGQYAPGSRLPSTRQLALQTGLHRNTVSKVYRQLEEMGLVETRVGSGIYVRDPAAIDAAIRESALVEQTAAYQLVRQSLDTLLKAGCTLLQAQSLFNAEIEWRLRCSAQIWIAVPHRDYGTGRLMVAELQAALNITIQLVPLEELEMTLQQAQMQMGTVLTIWQFLSQVEAIARPWSIRVIPIEIYNYTQEVNQIKALPLDTCIGLVSLSSAILEVASVIIHSIRGEELLVITAVATDLDRVRHMVRRAQVVITDSSSYATVKTIVREARPDLIRVPELFRVENYVSRQSLELLQRELGVQVNFK